MKRLHIHCPYCGAPAVRRYGRDLFGDAAADPGALYYAKRVSPKDFCLARSPFFPVFPGVARDCGMCYNRRKGHEPPVPSHSLNRQMTIGEGRV